MSLEEALLQNTQSNERLADMMGKFILALEKAPAKRAPKKASKKEELKEEAVEEPAVDAPEPESIFPVGGEPIAPETTPLTAPPSEGSAPPSEGSAPITNNRSDYNVYCMNLCNQYSAETGDPTLTLALTNKHGVQNLSTADDQKLVPIVSEIVPLIEALGHKPVMS